MDLTVHRYVGIPKCLEEHPQRYWQVPQDLDEWFVCHDYDTSSLQPTWAGYCSARTNRGVEEKSLIIEKVFVKECYRGNGIQRILLDSCELFARQKGFLTLTASTNYDNLVSSNNFIRRGFTLCKPWWNLDGLYWRKKIEK